MQEEQGANAFRPQTTQDSYTNTSQDREPTVRSICHPDLRSPQHEESFGLSSNQTDVVTASGKVANACSGQAPAATKVLCPSAGDSHVKNSLNTGISETKVVGTAKNSSTTIATRLGSRVGGYDMYCEDHPPFVKQAEMLGCMAKHDLCGMLRVVEMCKDSFDCVKSQRFPESPFLVAVKAGEVALARSLIKYGADIDATDPHGNSALFIAIDYACNRRNPVEFRLQFEIIVELLLTSSANVNPESGHIPLIAASAAAPGFLDHICDELIAKGADVNKTDSLGATPLLRAVYAENCLLVTKLIRHGAVVTGILLGGCNASMTYLEIALRFSSFQMITLLLRHGADPTVLDINSILVQRRERCNSDCSLIHAVQEFLLVQSAVANSMPTSCRAAPFMSCLRSRPLGFSSLLYTEGPARISTPVNLSASNTQNIMPQCPMPTEGTVSEPSKDKSSGRHEIRGVHEVLRECLPPSIDLNIQRDDNGSKLLKLQHSNELPSHQSSDRFGEHTVGAQNVSSPAPKSRNGGPNCRTGLEPDLMGSKNRGGVVADSLSPVSKNSVAGGVFGAARAAVPGRTLERVNSYRESKAFDVLENCRSVKVRRKSLLHHPLAHASIAKVSRILSRFVLRGLERKTRIHLEQELKTAVECFGLNGQALLSPMPAERLVAQLLSSYCGRYGKKGVFYAAISFVDFSRNDELNPQYLENMEEFPVCDSHNVPVSNARNSILRMGIDAVVNVWADFVCTGFSTNERAIVAASLLCSATSFGLNGPALLSEFISAEDLATELLSGHIEENGKDGLYCATITFIQMARHGDLDSSIIV